MPLRPSVFGTTTLFTFLMMFPLRAAVICSGSRPSRLRSFAAQSAIAIGSVQPMAGISSSRRMAV